MRHATVLRGVLNDKERLGRTSVNVATFPLRQIQERNSLLYANPTSYVLHVDRT